MTTLTAIMFVALIVSHKASLKTDIILGISVGLIILATVISIIVICNYMSSSDDSLKNHLMKLNSEEQSSYKIIKNISNDRKYFAYETGKNEFDNLPVDVMRSRKTYYDSDYKLTKTGQTQSDIEEYFGGKKGCEELIKRIEEVIESYNFTYVITALSVLIILLIIIFMVKASCQKDINKNVNPFPNPEEDDNEELLAQSIESLNKLREAALEGK